MLVKKKIKFYCPKGRHRFKTSNYKLVKWKNGVYAYKTICPKHENVVYQIKGREPDMDI